MEPPHSKFEQLKARLYEIEGRVREAARVQTEQFAPSQRLRSTPDWVRRTIRLSMCLVLLGVLGHSNYGNKDLAGELQKSANWAAITCIVVTAPLIGQVAEVSVYRIVGTLIGGFTGFAVWSLGNLVSEHVAGMLVVCLSPLVILPTVYLAFKHQAEQLSKFVQLTYVIVGYNAKRSKSAAILALLRVAGIICGGLLSLVLAVLVLPRSATVESCRELKKALKALADLNRAVWAASSTPLPAPEMKKKLGLLDHLNRMSVMGPFVSSTTRGLSRTKARSLQDMTTASAAALQDIMQGPGYAQQVEVEKLFNAVHSSLAKVEQMLGMCKGEVYIGQLYGNFIFLPSWLPSQIYGIKFKQLGAWHLPYDDVMLLLTILRRVARLLWSLLLDIDEGFDDTLQEVLAQYPKALMSEVALYINKSLLDLHAAFPNNSLIEIDNLMNLGQVVDCLITLSDARHRDAVFNMRSKRKAGRSAFSQMLSPDADPYASLATVRGSGAGTGVSATRQQSAAARQQSDASNMSPMYRSLDPAGFASGIRASVALATAAPAPAVFASRALSAHPGELSLVELPPRRLLQCTSIRRSVDMPSSAGGAGAGRAGSGGDAFNEDELGQSLKFDGMQSLGRKGPRPSRPFLPTILSELDMSSLIPAAPQMPSPSPFSDPANTAFMEQALTGTQPAGASGRDSTDSSNLGQRTVQDPLRLPGSSSSKATGSAAQGTQQAVHAQPGDAIKPEEAETQPLLPAIRAEDLRAQPEHAGADVNRSSNSSSSAGHQQSIGSATSQSTSSDAGTLERQPLLASTLSTEPDADTEQLPLLAAYASGPSFRGLANSAGWAGSGPVCITPRASLTSQADACSSGSSVGAAVPTAVVKPAAARLSACSATSDASGEPTVCRTPRASWEGDLDAANSVKVVGDTAAQLAAEVQQPAGATLPGLHSTLTRQVLLAQTHAHNKHLHQTRAQGVAPSLLSERLEMLLTSCTFEPIVFPANEQGWAAQVRWHSLQWLLNELVEELEEAFLGVSTIMGRLPHPIK